MSSNIPISLTLEKELSESNMHKLVIAYAPTGDKLVGLLTEDFGLDIGNEYGANDENFFGNTDLGNTLQKFGSIGAKTVEKTASSGLGTDVRLSKNSAIQHWQDTRRWSFNLTFVLVNYSAETRNIDLLKKLLKTVLPTRTTGSAAGNVASEVTMGGQRAWLSAPSGYGISSWDAATGGKFTGTWSVSIGEYMHFKDLVCTSFNFKLSKERSRSNKEPIWIEVTTAFEPADMITAENVDSWFSI